LFLSSSACTHFPFSLIYQQQLSLFHFLPLSLPCNILYIYNILYSQYIYSLLLFIISNKNLFFANGEIHEYRTRVYKDIHMPAVNLTKYKKGPYITGIKVFNCLPQSIKMLVNEEKSFKSALKRFLYHHSFYSINEYYQHAKS
jgi:hypothetical protein